MRRPAVAVVFIGLGTLASLQAAFAVPQSCESHFFDCLEWVNAGPEQEASGRATRCMLLNKLCEANGNWNGEKARPTPERDIMPYDGGGGRPSRPSGDPMDVPPKPKGGRTIDTVTAGTCADRGNCGGRRAPPLGAPVNSTLNGVAPSKTAPASSTGAALNGLKAGAPSQTAAAAVSTGAALNTQAATGLTGIDKSVATPSQLSDHLSRMRR